jgi:hypothetical protein
MGLGPGTCLRPASRVKSPLRFSPPDYKGKQARKMLTLHGVCIAKPFTVFSSTARQCSIYLPGFAGRSAPVVKSRLLHSQLAPRGQALNIVQG